MAAITFLKAILNHVKLDDSREKLVGFRAELGKLTPDDRQWFKDRFAIEYGYTVVDGQTAALVVAASPAPPVKQVERGAA